jgi:hypothetical protein
MRTAVCAAGDHGIESDEALAGRGGQGSLDGLACGLEAATELTEDGGPSGRLEGCKVESGADDGPAAGDRACPGLLAAVARDGR